LSADKNRTRKLIQFFCSLIDFYHSTFISTCSRRW